MSRIQEIELWARTRENLDVYQINAFIIGTGQRKFYPIGLWKLTACIGLQIFAIVFLTAQTWQEGGFDCSDSKVCQGYNGDVFPEAWMAFFFVSFVSITCAEKLRNLGDSGMCVDDASASSGKHMCVTGMAGALSSPTL